MKQPLWQWAAQGKHPVVNDYIQLGRGFPLVAIFADWVKNGYHLLALKKTLSSQPRSWRFWTRGSGKNTLVCGLVRDSSDRLGRPYPFLIMGTGSLPGWEDQWDLVSLACERAWSQMEHLATSVGKEGSSVTDVRHLEDKIMVIKPPLHQWPQLLQERENCQGLSVVTWDSEDVARRTLGLAQKEEVFIDLDQGHDYTPLILVDLWHRHLKAHLGNVPKAVFMGGTVDKISLAVFQRPLRSDDFLRLWSS